MEKIQINVAKQLDGYTFSLGVTTREKIKSWFPNAHPANLLFINYDIKSGFELQYDYLEQYVYPALMGIKPTDDLCAKVSEVVFYDSKENKQIHVYSLADEKA